MFSLSCKKIIIGTFSFFSLKKSFCFWLMKEFSFMFFLLKKFLYEKTIKCISNRKISLFLAWLKYEQKEKFEIKLIRRFLGKIIRVWLMRLVDVWRVMGFFKYFDLDASLEFVICSFCVEIKFHICEQKS